MLFKIYYNFNLIKDTFILIFPTKPTVSYIYISQFKRILEIQIFHCQSLTENINLNVFKCIKFNEFAR